MAGHAHENDVIDARLQAANGESAFVVGYAHTLPAPGHSHVILDELGHDCHITDRFSGGCVDHPSDDRPAWLEPDRVEDSCIRHDLDLQADIPRMRGSEDATGSLRQHHRESARFVRDSLIEGRLAFVQSGRTVGRVIEPLDCHLDPGNRDSFLVHEGAFDSMGQRQQLHGDRIVLRAGGPLLAGIAQDAPRQGLLPGSGDQDRRITDGIADDSTPLGIGREVRCGCPALRTSTATPGAPSPSISSTRT